MKNILLYFLMAIFCLISCSDNDKSNINNNIVQSSDLTDYRILSNDPLYDIVLNPDRNSIQELDEYYREIKESRKSELRYDNLRKVIISQMYFKEQEFLKEMEKEKLEYYTNEILSMEYISDMEMLAKMLVNLSPYWDDEKIQKVSRMALDRNVKFISENFDDQKKIYDNPKQGYGVLKLKHLKHFKSNKD